MQPEDLECGVSEFLAHQRATELAVVITLDGKTLRGMIPVGETRGLHLLATYLPEAGVVLLQMESGGERREA